MANHSQARCLDRVWSRCVSPQPNAGDDPDVGHEAFYFLNVIDQEAVITLDFYFKDRSPTKEIAIALAAEWSIKLIEVPQIGIYHVTGPREPLSLKMLLDTLARDATRPIDLKRVAGLSLDREKEILQCWHTQSK